MDFYFALFPDGGLANSITTTVWIGILVVAFFNLRFGWVLSGLVVPGYLVPLLIIKPIAVGVILTEAIVTYLIMLFFSRFLARVGFWSDFFGRDRFFAILLISTLVRVIFDGYFLIEFGEAINSYFNINFDYRNNLHSFGLIIVALIANQFYKPGIIKGIIPLFVTVFITYFITKYLLIGYTNFTISNLSYIYEDISSSILASPKAYIILLTTAFIASRMNLKYGWDFNGILIPSLLALQWYEPIKILISFLEAFIILGASMLILKLPIFKNSSIEKARKLILFFNVGFVYKVLLSIALVKFFPDEKVTDYFAFGYLLSTLIAVKMHDKDIAIRLTRATIETSFKSIIVASLIGFSFTLIPNFLIDKEPKSIKNIVLDSNLTLDESLKKSKLELYKSLSWQYKKPTEVEMELFKSLVRELSKIETSQRDKLLNIANRLIDINYSLKIIENRYFLLNELNPKSGWGLYLIDSKSDSRLIIETPFALDEWSSFESSSFLFKIFEAKALAISSVKLSNEDESLNPLKNRFSIFNSFHRAFEFSSFLQVRAFTKESARILKALRDEEPKTSSLYIKTSIPKDFNLKRLSKYINFETKWNVEKMDNVQREDSKKRFAELFLSKNDRRTLLSKQFTIDLEEEKSTQRIDGYLQDWILSNKDRLIAKINSNLYKKPSDEEILFFDQEILTPILKMIKDKNLLDLNSINTIANSIGYKIVKYRDIEQNREFLILHSDTNYWGTYVFRVGRANNYSIAVPRVLFDRYSFEYGVFLFERLKAKSIFIAGTHPYANSDKSSDIVKFQNYKNIFNLANQVALREDENLTLIHLRGFNNKFNDSDVVLAFDTTKKLSKSAKEIVQELKKDNLKIDFADGGFSAIGYEITSNYTYNYIKQSDSNELIMLWLSSNLRDKFAKQIEHSFIDLEFKSLGIESSEASLKEFILESKKSKRELNRDLLNSIESFLSNFDIVTLYKIKNSYLEFEFKRLIDVNSKKAFLTIFYRDRLVSIIDLARAKKLNRISLNIDNISKEQVLSFLESSFNYMDFR